MPPVFGPWSSSNTRFMVLGRDRGTHPLAVAYHQERQFLAGEAFFQYHPRPGFAHHFSGEHLLGGALRLLLGSRDDDALAAGQTVPAFTTMGAWKSLSASCTSAFVVQTEYLAVGMRCRCMNSLAKLLLDSRRAAARVGPKMGQPRLWNSSTTPSVNGGSGPTTVKSGFNLLASCTSESTLFRSAAMHSASAAMPPLPGAQYSFFIRDDCRSFHTMACSRPPLPRTRTFMSQASHRFSGHHGSGGKRKKRVGVRSGGCQTTAGGAGSHAQRGTEDAEIVRKIYCSCCASVSEVNSSRAITGRERCEPTLHFAVNWR